MVTLLSPYLLSSQSDRVNLAHGVEGRYPFLSHKLFEFTAGLPREQKLYGLREKRILRTWCRKLLPEVADRPKQPYRAPDISSFCGPEVPAYVSDLLSPDPLRSTRYWSPGAVGALVRRANSGRAVGIRENQAFVAVLTTELWHDRFMRAPNVRPLDGAPAVHLRDGNSRGTSAVS
jgi:asparagine synthase (glutamine-hydrolysing)